MMCKILVYSLLFTVYSVLSPVPCPPSPVYCAQELPAQESDQQISDFSLSGYADKGKKSWDIAGKTADIFDNVIALKEVVGNLYGEAENTNLTAKTGNFDKAEGRVHLEEDVVITTSSGARLTTDSLDWDRKNQEISTKDKVNIERENMLATALGAIGHPNLSKFNLEKEVQVEIEPEPADKPVKQGGGAVKNKIVITCDGPLEIDYQKNIATFKNNVKVDNQDSIIYSDIMYVYFLDAPAPGTGSETDDTQPALMGSKIDKIISRGNVKIVKGENISYSDEAVYNSADKKIILTGKPKLILYSTDDLTSTMAGN